MSIYYPPPPYVLNNDLNELESLSNNIDTALPNYYECLNNEDYQKIMPPKYIISEWYENEKNLSQYKGAKHIYEEAYFLPLPSLIILIFVNCLFITFFTIWSILFIIKNETSFTFGIYLSPETMLYLISVLIPIMVLYIFGSLFFLYIIYTPICVVIVFYTTFAVYLYLIYLVKEYILYNRNKLFLDALLIGLLAVSLGIFSTLYCTILYLDHKVLYKYLKQKKYLENEFVRINFQNAVDEFDNLEGSQSVA